MGDQLPTLTRRVKLNSGYFSTGAEDIRKYVNKAFDILLDRGVDFDTIVVTGISGMVVGPMLAEALEKDLLIIRKEGENSHASYLAEGVLGERWLFVDDFIASGKTFNRVCDAIERLSEGLRNYRDTKQDYWYSPPAGIETQCVGVYEYTKENFTASGGNLVGWAFSWPYKKDAA